MKWTILACINSLCLGVNLYGTLRDSISWLGVGFNSCGLILALLAVHWEKSRAQEQPK